MRAAITGARGFVGRHLAAHLTARGDEVVELDLDGARALDVTDHDAVVARVAAERPDAVYHLAARSHVGESWAAGDALTRVNVGGTRAVVDACVRAGVHRVLVVGSAEQYGAVHDDELPIRESTALRPITPYGETKAAAEQVALAAHREHGLGVVCARAFNHTGPGQPSAFLVPGLAARIAAAERSGADEIVLGNGDPVRDFSDVRDVVRAYALLMARGASGEIYNVASGTSHSMRSILDLLVAQSRIRVTVEVDPARLRPSDTPVLTGNADKLRAATGWIPAIAFDRMLRDLLDYWRKAA